MWWLLNNSQPDAAIVQGAVKVTEHTHRLLAISNDALVGLVDNDEDYQQQLREATQQFLACVRRILVRATESSTDETTGIEDAKLLAIDKAKIKLAKVVKHIILAAHRGLDTKGMLHPRVELALAAAWGRGDID
jgi:hypothetical protein